MNYSQETIFIFNKCYDRLKPFHNIMKTTTPVLAFSGGKDSTLLANFYKFHFLHSNSPEPILFHLDHSIRNNREQEKQIEMEMKNYSTKYILKKKKFLN